MTTKWQIEYAVDAFGTVDVEADTEDEAWGKFLEAWEAGLVAPPDDFSEPERQDASITEEKVDKFPTRPKSDHVFDARRGKTEGCDAD